MKPLLKILTPLILCGLLLLHPQMSYQTALSQGDHGRDLYAFSAVMRGDVPYRDFWWVYGPLIPYYYALMFKIFGSTVAAALIGKVLLKIIAGCFFYLALNLFIPALMAFIATLWFWTFLPDFFFTFNHAGGVAALMAVAFFLCRTIVEGRDRPLYYALFAAFILCLIKINFGLVALFIILFLPAALKKMGLKVMTKNEASFYAAGFMIFPVLVLSAYIFCLSDLPVYAMRQCLPYLSADHPHNAPALLMLKAWWQAIAVNINTSWANRIFAVLLIGSIIYTAIALEKQKQDTTFKRKFIAVVLLMGLFYTLNMHEYIVSGVLYRTYWAAPFSVFLVFLFIGYALSFMSQRTRNLLVIALFLIILSKYTDALDTIRLKRANGNYLSLPAGKVTLGNDLAWIATVEETTRILNNTLKPDETFFAMPYDPIYYFLSGRKSPTRQLIFFEHINIPPEQEKKIIKELEDNKVNVILLTSRINSPEPGLGVFGRTYCPLLGKYVGENFEQVIAIGDWSNFPGWAWNHGTAIFKRKQP